MHWRTVVLGAVAVIAGIVLFGGDPEQGGFLVCPFRYVTGWQCPGCGSQRALHDLLHLRIGEAFGHNALLVLAIPLLPTQWAIGRFIIGRPLASYNAVVFGWLAVVLIWWVGRDLAQ